jgi:hypothetical protein
MLNFNAKYLIILLISFAANAQQLTKQEINDIDNKFIEMARGVNKQIGGTKTDALTTFKSIFYSPDVRTLTYFVGTTATNGLNKVQIKNLYDYHREKACKLKFAPLMKSYDLKIEYAFENEMTGKKLVNFIFDKKDCKFDN